METGTGTHRCRLTETNTGSVVAVCRCGWLSGVHVPAVTVADNGSQMWRDHAGAHQAAVDDYTAHVRSARVTAAAAVDERLAATVRNRRRYSHQ